MTTPIVVKIGGEVIDDPRYLQIFAAECAALHQDTGIPLVIVHGGGTQISSMSARLGITPTFLDGLRITTAAEMQIVEMVLAGSVNSQVVRVLQAHDIAAVGISAVSGHMLKAEAMDPLGKTGGATNAPGGTAPATDTTSGTANSAENAPGDTANSAALVPSTAHKPSGTTNSAALATDTTSGMANTPGDTPGDTANSAALATNRTVPVPSTAHKPSGTTNSATHTANRTAHKPSGTPDTPGVARTTSGTANSATNTPGDTANSAALATNRTVPAPSTAHTGGATNSATRTANSTALATDTTSGTANSTVPAPSTAHTPGTPNSTPHAPGTPGSATPAIQSNFTARTATCNPHLLLELCAHCVPVVAPLGSADDGTVYNVNADIGAVAIAHALAARALVFVTDVDGVYNQHKEVIRTLDRAQYQALVNTRVVQGGMRAKLDACYKRQSSNIKKIIIGKIQNKNDMLSLLEQRQGTILL